MRVGAGALGLAAAILATILTGCSGSSSDDGNGAAGTSGSSGASGTGGGSGNACTAEDECDLVDCRCVNDIQHNNEAECKAGFCVPAQTLCDERCANYGGVEGFGPGGSVADSAACTAYCDKIVATCPGVTCNKDHLCSWHYGECAQGKIEELECNAEQAEIECLPDGWNATLGSCQPARARCPGGV